MADAGPDQTFVTKKKDVKVVLDGSASFDPDGTIVSYLWTRDGKKVGDKVTKKVKLKRGTTTLVLTVTDDDGASSSDEVVVTITKGTQVSGGD